MSMAEVSAEALAHQVGEHMLSTDTASRETMGMELMYC